MKTLLIEKGLLGTGLGITQLVSSAAVYVLTLGAACPAGAERAEDAEDSPLYLRSRQAVFAQMALRDGDPSGGQIAPALTNSVVIVVEGSHWARADSGGGDAAGKARRTGARPLDVTTDVSCFPTMAISCSTPCGPTWDATPTCHGANTCHVPGPTCIYATCDGQSPTCSANQPTCFGVSCNQPGYTCSPCYTMDGPSCSGTCTPANCPTTLDRIHVSETGEVSVSFSSSHVLSYALQCCTNLSEAQWTEVATALGNDAVLTLSHTNWSPRAFYRVVVGSLSGSAAPSESARGSGLQ